MAGTKCLKSPDLHLSETLTTKLCLTTKWLLGNQAVRTNRTGMHLVLYHVTKLQEVGNTYRCRLVKLLTCLTIIQMGRAEAGKSCLICPLGKVLQFSTIEDWRSELHTKTLTGSTEDSLENLTEVHTRRHTQRVEYQVYRTTVL